MLHLVLSDKKETARLCAAHDGMRHAYFRKMLGLSNGEQDEASDWVRPNNVTWLWHADHGFLAVTGPKALSDNCADICSGAGLPLE